MKAQYSQGSKFFLDSIEKKKEKDQFIPFLKNFEMCCILSDFDEAVLAIPFDTEEYKEGLEKVYNYVRQIVLSKLSQKLLVTSYYKEDKASHDSISLLVSRLSKDPEVAGTTAKKIIFELNE